MARQNLGGAPVVQLGPGAEWTLTAAGVRYSGRLQPKLRDLQDEADEVDVHLVLLGFRRLTAWISKGDGAYAVLASLNPDTHPGWEPISLQARLLEASNTILIERGNTIVAGGQVADSNEPEGDLLAVATDWLTHNGYLPETDFAREGSDPGRPAIWRRAVYPTDVALADGVVAGYQYLGTPDKDRHTATFPTWTLTLESVSPGETVNLNVVLPHLRKAYDPNTNEWFLIRNQASLTGQS